MNELQFAYKIRQHLNRGLYVLRPETASRLAAARQNALACQKQAVSQSVLAAAGSFVQFQLENMRIKQVFISLALLLCVVTAAFWTADYRIAELSAIDSALLTDELPIGAFTDKGFDAWLKRASSE
jgi:Protein of unknown function (DUF3619)